MRVLSPFVFVRSLRHSVAAAALFTLTVALPGAARAQTAPTVLHEFSNDGANGSHAISALIQGADGNFYGTTLRGGYSNNGTVFRLAPNGTLTVLFAFDGGGYGGEPAAALVAGTDGNFYGTTQAGGYYNEGVAFRITPAGVLTVIFDFGGDEGSQPVSSLVLGADGNFYGTTQFGGYHDQGTVFQLSADGGTYNVLFDFGGDYGQQPVTALTAAADGTFYGTTQFGGYYGKGTVFQITTAGALTVLHDFQGGSDGVYPQGALTLLPGTTTFYGTASEGGTRGYGTVFEITAAGTFTKLHDFTGADGSHPEAALVSVSDGNFYGTTYYGGSGQDNGTVFALTPSGGFTSVTIFNRTTGQYPAAPLLQAADGLLYGTTYGGGGADDGTVFQLNVSAPVPHLAFFSGETAVGNGVYFLTFPNGNFFGYYSYLSDPHYLYHFDLGYEYVSDAADGHSGVYLYDFKSGGYFYTSLTFPFPYLYDFSLNSVVYYYPDPNNPGRYNTNGTRFFYVFSTGKIISK